ncbi:MAG: Fe-S cluster assembly protein SufD [Terracidiphilus sp.]
MVTAERLKNYFEAYSELVALREEIEPVWLRHLRGEAWAKFHAKGFPTTHDEDWRFTSVTALARTPFRRAPVPAEASDARVSSREAEPFRFAGAACELVFVDGRYAPELSNSRDLPAGLEVCGLAQARGAAAEEIEQHLGRYADLDRDVFPALNTALWEDGAYIRIRRGAAIEQPVHLLYISVGGGDPIMTHPRTLIVAEQASHAAVVEDYVSIGAGAAFCNSVTELVAGDDANIAHYLVERENLDAFNFSTLRIELGRDAKVTSHSLLVGGGLVRNNVHPVLSGQGAECLINGLFIGAGQQHLDNYMLVEHVGLNGSSRQFYNGILDDQAHGVFHGRIFVHKDAQKTDAKQTNRNLLLSDDARLDTKPQLEIRADDVKCTHGATIGQIEEEQLFYLRSRGFSEVAARSLLLSAFAGECVGRMNEPLVRGFIEKLTRQRLLELARTPHPAVKTASPHAESTQNGKELE